MNGPKRIHSVALGVAALALAQVAFACPTCGNSIEHSGGNLAEGFYWSILFMMSMPFVILGGLSLLCWLEIRKARRAAETAAQSCATAGLPSRAGHAFRSSSRELDPMSFAAASVTAGERP